MAQTAKRATIAVYDGQVVISDIVKRKTTVPIFSSNETYSATLVTSWYDGSPMDDTKADGSVYFKLKALPQGADPDIYGQYVGSYFRVNLPKFGETFLEKDTMQAMRDLSPVEVLLLQVGYYKGVKLNGYYTKDDTPSPIEYYLSDTSATDDGGSVIVVGGIKLEHVFVGDINLKYFGIEEGDILNSLLDKSLSISSQTNSFVIIPEGNYLINRNYVPVFNSRIRGVSKNNTKITLNPSSATDSGEGFENYMILNLNGGIEIRDLKLDANKDNITALRSSAIDNRNNSSNAVYQDLIITNAKAKMPEFSGGYGITFWHGGCDNVIISNIDFENIGQSDLGLFEMENFTVRNITSKNCAYMVINVESSNNARLVKNGVVDTVYATNVGKSVISLIRNGASVGDVDNVVIRNVYVDKCAMSDNQVGAIRVRGTKNCLIENVNIGETGSCGIRVSGDWFGFKGTVTNYSDLPTAGLSQGDIYRVSSENMMYTYKSGSFQPQGEGQSDDLLKCKNLTIRNVNVNKITATANAEGIRVQGEIFCNHDNITIADVYLANTQSTGFLGTYTDRLTINNFKVDKVNTSRGMQFTLCNNLHVNGGQVSEIGTHGVGFTDCKEVNINSLKILNCVGSGFISNNTTDIVKLNNTTVRDNRATKLTVNGVTITSTLVGMTPRFVITGNDFEDVTGSKVTIQNEIVRTKMSIFNNIGISDIATTTVKGIVNQTGAVPDVDNADMSIISTANLVDTTATDVEGLKTYINTSVKNLVNEIKAKTNENVNMGNKLKLRVNTKFAYSRTAGQQAP